MFLTSFPFPSSIFSTLKGSSFSTLKKENNQLQRKLSQLAVTLRVLKSEMTGDGEGGGGENGVDFESLELGNEDDISIDSSSLSSSSRPQTYPS